jgi:hypothetical protein
MVIGGHAAGVSAMSQARRQCPVLQIVAFEACYPAHNPTA